MEYQISLPEDVYAALLAAAQEHGLSPADWIASKLPDERETKRSLPELVSDLIGAINSQEIPKHQYEQTSFGEIIATKLAKQGIHRP